MTNQTKKKKHSPLVWGVYILLGLMMALALYLMGMKMANRIPSFFGYSMLQIVSPSMEETIPTGEYILIRKTEPTDVRSGDIITFYSTDSAIYMQANTHRVVSVDSTGGTPVFTTKGDNNPVEDQTKVPAENLIGKYQRSLPALSKIGGIFQNKIVFLILILIPAAIFLIMELVNVAKISHSVRQDARRQAFITDEIARLRAEKGDSDGTENEKKQE